MRCHWPFLILLSAPQLTRGWGDVGHRTVAYLAEQYLDDEGSKLIKDLLLNNGSDISDAAVWPDTIKWKRPETRPWHFIDANHPPKSCGVSYETDCGNGGCIISALEEMTHKALDLTLDKVSQAESLRFILHFLGDIHQPLHVEGAYKGGNGILVHFGRRRSHENLHSVWDTDIPHKINGIAHNIKHNDEREAAKRWAGRLAQSDLSRSLRGEECTDVSRAVECAMVWARETNRLNCEFVLKRGVEWLEENDLGGNYYDGAAPIVEAQVYRAGVRLAGWLNALAAERAARGDFVRADL
ncbi:S1/P1 nuclease [Aspergillus alliaceus]|uniref:S1/P1 nuclease n=1 Tax=Petromyces alliaceus TaxID=209559 RepID=UPI0012A69266|nr:S1/P1 nuclease [Aspergillus alliaceus]KAB8231455.1 S1/P1 nuclease [Aspergillus alliaceus]